MTTPTSCKSKLHSAETIDQIEGWRSQYESNPAVSINFVSQTCGVSVGWLKSYMCRRGWSKSAQAKKESLRLGAKISRAKKYNLPPPAALPTPELHRRPAYPSVWAMAQKNGLTLTSGGRIISRNHAAAA